jgi:hypothetical protein
MADRTPIVIVDTFQDVVDKMNVVLLPILKVNVKYFYGSSIQILKMLKQLNEGITIGNRFPLIALFQPFEEKMGGNGYYTQLTIPKMVIAMLTDLNYETPTRYTKTFKPVLYPIYYELLNQIALNGNFEINDPGMIPHTKLDNPGSPPPKGETFNEFVDAIEIFNLELTFNAQLNC